MKPKNLIITAVSVFTIGTFIITPLTFADDENQDLKQQVKELQQKVNELESALQTKGSTTGYPQPTKRSWDPFIEMDRIQEEMNRLFQNSFSRNVEHRRSNINSLFHPEIDIAEMKNEYVLKLDLPGMDKGNIKIETEAHYLEISGKKNTELIEEDGTNHYYRKERSFGHFSRTIPLPEDADRNKIEAKYKEGVLTVKIAKIKGVAKNTFKRKIDIN